MDTITQGYVEKSVPTILHHRLQTWELPVKSTPLIYYSDIIFAFIQYDVLFTV